MTVYIAYSNERLRGVALHVGDLLAQMKGIKIFVRPQTAGLNKGVKEKISKADFVVILEAPGETLPGFKAEVDLVRKENKLSFWPKLDEGLVGLLLLQRHVQGLREEAGSKGLDEQVVLGIALLTTGLIRLEAR